MNSLIKNKTVNESSLCPMFKKGVAVENLINNSIGIDTLHHKSFKVGEYS